MRGFVVQLAQIFGICSSGFRIGLLGQVLARPFSPSNLHLSVPRIIFCVFKIRSPIKNQRVFSAPSGKSYKLYQKILSAVNMAKYFWIRTWLQDFVREGNVDGNGVFAGLKTCVGRSAFSSFQRLNHHWSWDKAA